MRASIALVALVCTSAAADAGTPRVTDKLTAQLAPMAKLAAAEREKQMCSSADAILETAMAISEKKAPAGVPLDKRTWEDLVLNVQQAADTLAMMCKLPNHAQKTATGKLATASMAIDDMLATSATLADAARPRTLSPQLTAARTAIAAIHWDSKQFCTQAKTAVKQLTLVTKPSRAPAAWDKQFAEVAKRATGVKDTACENVKHAPEEVAGLPVELSQQFYKLVLLVPAT